MNDPVPLWRPDGVSETRFADFLRFLRREYGVDFGELDYAGLHTWSVAEPAQFWDAIARFGDVRFHRPPRAVVENLDDITQTRWFPGSTLNYAGQALTGRGEHDLAILFEREDGLREQVTYGQLRERVAAARAGLVDLGVGRGDRVVALAPNCVETVVAFLAAASLGAIWACCSPDFGARAVEDRFEQLAPTVLIAVDGYQYNGRAYSLSERVERLRTALPSLRATVLVPYLDPGARVPGTMSWAQLTARTAPLEFAAVPFDHPLWVLYSSGTTGLPKGIVHGHGGIVVEHLKVLAVMSDLRPGDRFFWFTTTGWMMWNYVLGALLAGATIVCYDGSPSFPDDDRLWAMAEEYRIGFFGVSASFLHAALRAGRSPGRKHDLGAMRMLGSTGSPLSPDGFAWVAEHVGPQVQIYSNSGGTDVCTPFIMSAPNVPVWSGEISCAALGVAVEAFDPAGRAVLDELGELVVTTPMPSMPVGFWNDEDGTRLRAAYFEDFPGVWRHGDWVRKTPRGSYVVYGRSDSTLNRGGVRMGTAEFYSVIESSAEVEDSLVVDISSGNDDAPLLCFLVLAPDADEETTVAQVRAALRRELSPRHVPDRFVRIAEVPRTLNGKKCEVPVKRILLGASPETAVSRSALQNAGAIDEFVARRAEFTATEGKA
ncbi:acetoacetate--CoA ligase [Amycolatopsis jejuensis]|uniref:acetoacetate--CoA ligase n=1 Tax=Amycolatopsis jejuensis TaxID=330084 RepID=UPI0005273231|nr:acetoacetate--CoA ligase [Amycolatopsis jejuensis]